MREAEDSRNPLLERLKFLAIVSSNLDEFFMKRIGGLKQQLGAGVARLTVDGRTPKQQIEECYQQVRTQEARQHDSLRQILTELRRHDIKLLGYEELSQADATYLRDYYHENIFPLLTPQSIDPAHPFPFVSNLSLNLLVRTRFPGEKGKMSLARIKVPTSNDVPRFLQLPGRNHFVALEDVARHNLDLLLPESKRPFSAVIFIWLNHFMLYPHRFFVDHMERQHEYNTLAAETDTSQPNTRSVAIAFRSF